MSLFNNNCENECSNKVTAIAMYNSTDLKAIENNRTFEYKFKRKYGKFERKPIHYWKTK